ncbi:MAG: WD40/YVTN/BNR-like repeat-containing protein, partial [Candidatus Kapaibacterium sp.]
MRTFRLPQLSLLILLTSFPTLLVSQVERDGTTPYPANEEWMDQFESNGIDPRVTHRETDWYRLMKGENPNVLDVMRAYEEWFREHPFQRSHETQEYPKWIRLHYLNIDAAGNALSITPDPVGTERFLQQNSRYDLRAEGKGVGQSAGGDSRWELIGPVTWDREARAATGSMGVGVIRAVEVDPTNPDNVYLGTVSAGIWLSRNRGESWSEATVGTLVEETREIAISKANPNIVYAATNVGVIKSTDKGTTWNYTTFGGINNYPSVQAAHRIAVSPTSADVLLCAAGNRLFRSEDGGVEWESVYSASSSGNSIWDVEFHPTDGMIVYLLAQNGSQVDFLRSTDGGKTFNPGAAGYPSPVGAELMRRGVIALSSAAPQKVHVIIAGSANDSISGLWGNYVSWDAGISFTHLCCGEVDGPEAPDPANGNPNILHYNAAENGLGQVTWDIGYAMSDRDTNVLIAAGIFPWRSADGGRSWLSTPGIHYDVQDVAIGGGTIWIATDGGIFRSDDNGITITDESDGINSIEVWGFAQALKRPDLMVIGAYHLPIFIRDDNTYSSNGFSGGGWYPWSGADAMNAEVNQIDDYWIYAKPWTNTRAYRSEKKDVVPSSQDLGIDLGYIPLTNIAFHPQLYHTIIAPDHGTPKRFAISSDNAGSWETLKTFANSVYRIRVSYSNPNWMYGIADGKLWMTSNGGREWSDITPPQSISTGKGLRDVVVDDRDERRIWVAFGGHQNSRKVVRSDDAGETWEDISGTLPSFGILSMVHQRGSDEGIYVGTTLGVYYRNGKMDDWELHGTGLPVADVNFLHINYTVGKLRAGTSRGLWETDLFEGTPPAAQISADRNEVACSRERVLFACGSAFRRSIATKWTWSFPGGTPS